jgi:hypothetical protein
MGAERPGALKTLVRGLKDEAAMHAITRALERANWKRKEAAEILNISYKALLYKIQYGIDPSRVRSAPSSPPQRETYSGGFKARVAAAGGYPES